MKCVFPEYDASNGPASTNIAWLQESVDLDYTQEYRIEKFFRRAFDVIVFSGVAFLSCYWILQSGR